MTPEEFRELALSLPGVVESAHMSHPDFRVKGKVFASLGYPDDQFGMVRLPVSMQRDLVKKDPKMFQPCAGAWGRRGCTNINLVASRRALVKAALKAGHQERMKG